MKDSKEKRMLSKIEALDYIEIRDSKFRTKVETLDNEIIKKNTEISFESDMSSLKTDKTAKSYQSRPFGKELDLDLPQFTSTKYASSLWKLFHSIFYFLYSGFLFGANLYYVISKNLINYNICALISHISYFMSSFLEWFHFKRGCIGYANLNSKIKDNIDYSIKARILRSEQGWKYFFSIFASIILIYGNIHYIIYNNKNNDEKLEKGIIPDVEFYNINLIGSMIISLAQILKIEKILIHTRQYWIKNDLSNGLIEIFLYFGSLCLGVLYYFNILYDYDIERFEILYNITRIGGSLLIFFSALCLLSRYYMTTYDDLNTSDLSNITI